MAKHGSHSATHLGAIFDWDGVVVDSSRHHEESWNRLASEVKLVLPVGHFLQGFGMKNEAIIPGILKWSSEPEVIRKLSLRKEELYRDLLREWSLDPLPGVREFLIRLQEAGVPRVIGSSTHRLNITTSLEILGLEDSFSAIVSAEDVHQGKPNPEVFLLAAAKINRPPAVCVVFEDAPMGIEAALAANMRAIGVMGTHGANVLGKAHKTVRRLDELEILDLESLFV